MRIVDFSIADNLNADYDIEERTEGHIEGTTPYIAPEVLNFDETERQSTKKDIWALGTIAYELCTKTPPYRRD